MGPDERIIPCKLFFLTCSIVKYGSGTEFTFANNLFEIKSMSSTEEISFPAMKLQEITYYVGKHFKNV